MDGYRSLPDGYRTGLGLLTHSLIGCSEYRRGRLHQLPAPPPSAVAVAPLVECVCPVRPGSEPSAGALQLELQASAGRRCICRQSPPPGNEKAVRAMRMWEEGVGVGSSTAHATHCLANLRPPGIIFRQRRRLEMAVALCAAPLRCGGGGDKPALEAGYNFVVLALIERAGRIHKHTARSNHLRRGQTRVQADEHHGNGNVST
jgi:hypothetical protein